jgi:hypothetical protein
LRSSSIFYLCIFLPFVFFSFISCCLSFAITSIWSEFRSAPLKLLTSFIFPCILFSIKILFDFLFYHLARSMFPCECSSLFVCECCVSDCQVIFFLQLYLFCIFFIVLTRFLIAHVPILIMPFFVLFCDFVRLNLILSFSSSNSVIISPFGPFDLSCPFVTVTLFI